METQMFESQYLFQLAYIVSQNLIKILVVVRIEEIHWRIYSKRLLFTNYSEYNLNGAEYKEICTYTTMRVNQGHS